MTQQTLAGRTALVTGAARGIGDAIARTLSNAGAAVIIADVLAAPGETVAADLRAAGGDARFVKLDVTREADWLSAVEAAVGACGGLDIVVNNAGIEVTSLIADADIAEMQRLLDVNVSGVLLGMKHAFRAMRPGGAAGGGGVVINISSTAAQTAFPSTGLYAATKAAVERLTMIGAVEAGKLGYGVRVNCVYPGFIETALSAGSAHKAVELGLFPDEGALGCFLIDQTPLGRLGAPQDVAEAVRWLCSDAAAFVTGVGLPVAGGMGAR